jgi:hypothetical protein
LQAKDLHLWNSFPWNFLCAEQLHEKEKQKICICGISPFVPSNFMGNKQKIFICGLIPPLCAKKLHGKKCKRFAFAD